MKNKLDVFEQRVLALDPDVAGEDRERWLEALCRLMKLGFMRTELRKLPDGNSLASYRRTEAGREYLIKNCPAIDCSKLFLD
jgi:hypothetical protein